MSVPGLLRVLSWRGRWHEALRTHVSDPFTDAFRVGVEHSLHTGLGLPGPLAQALEAGRVPPVDIVWSNAAAALRAAAAGHCVPIDPGRLNVLGYGDGLHDRARPQGYADFPVIHPYVMH
jgi:hypothetical protein